MHLVIENGYRVLVAVDVDGVDGRKNGSSMILLASRSVCITPGTVAGYQLVSLACLNFQPSFSSFRNGTAISKALHRSDEASKPVRFTVDFSSFIIYSFYVLWTSICKSMENYLYRMMKFY